MVYLGEIWNEMGRIKTRMGLRRRIRFEGIGMMDPEKNESWSNGSFWRGKGIVNGGAVL